jgi:hypothetical protein
MVVWLCGVAVRRGLGKTRIDVSACEYVTGCVVTAYKVAFGCSVMNAPALGIKSECIRRYPAEGFEIQLSANGTCIIMIPTKPSLAVTLK